MHLYVFIYLFMYIDTIGVDMKWLKVMSIGCVRLGEHMHAWSLMKQNAIKSTSRSPSSNKRRGISRARSCAELVVGKNFIDADHHRCGYEMVIHDVWWVCTFGWAHACLGPYGAECNSIKEPLAEHKKGGFFVLEFALNLCQQQAMPMPIASDANSKQAMPYTYIYIYIYVHARYNVDSEWCEERK